MNKKDYEAPMLEFIFFEHGDIVTTSGPSQPDSGDTDWEGGIDGGW